MRSPRFLVGLHAAVAMAALASAGPVAPAPDRPTPRRRVEVDGDDTISTKREEPPRRVQAAPKTFTEADNTRLRQAAERRFRKAQRQAKGFAR